MTHVGRSIGTLLLVSLVMTGCEDRGATPTGSASTAAPVTSGDPAAAAADAMAQAQAVEATLKTAARHKAVDGSKMACCEEHADTGTTAAAPTTQPAEAATGAVTEAASTGGTGKLRSSPWVEPEKRPEFNLDFSVTDQSGQMLKLGDLKGTPMVVSFFFTRCPNPQMCPLITSTMTALQRRAAEAGLAEKVRLVLISYDPHYDTPERITKYAKSYGFNFDNGLMLRPETEDYIHLLQELGVDIAPEPDGNIGHFIELILIDKHGRYVRDYTGAIWDNKAVLADVEKLAGENN